MPGWMIRLPILLCCIGITAACTDRDPPDLAQTDAATEPVRGTHQPIVSHTPEPSTGCPEPGSGPGVYQRTLTHNGWERQYILSVPETTDGMPHAHPLLIVMHGYGGNGAWMRDMLQPGSILEQDHIVLYPDGAASSDRMRGWNSGHPECCGTALEENLDDVGFIRQLVETVAQDACVDLSRVYATGFSNGGDMAQRLACDASDLMAAVTSVGGRFDYQARACPGQRAVSTILYRGQRDPVVPYTRQFFNMQAIKTIPAEKGFRQIAGNHGCRGISTDRLPMDNTECLQAVNCSAAVELMLCTVPAAGHCWPGIGNCSSTQPGAAGNFSANKHMHEFFARHRIEPDQVD